MSIKGKIYKKSPRKQIMLLMCVFFCSMLTLLWIAVDRRFAALQETQQSESAADALDVIKVLPVRDIQEIFGISEAEVEDIFGVTVTENVRIVDYNAVTVGLFERSYSTLEIEYTGTYDDFMELCSGEMEYYTYHGYIYNSDGRVGPDNGVHMYSESLAFIHKNRLGDSYRIEARLYEIEGGYKIELTE